ncbi:MAG: signal peptidase II [Candidatus Omnitrophota bacterium]
MHGVSWAIAVFVFVTEFFIKNYLANIPAFLSIPVINNILYITVVFNKGAAFSILTGQTTFLIYVGIVFIVLFFILMMRERKRSFIYYASCGLILGGALSNLCDRIFLGYVIDYIDFKVWPVFNLADSCITIGTLLLFINSFGKNGKNVDRSSRG